MNDPVAVLQKFLSAASHKRLAEAEIRWENPIDRNHKDYAKLMGIHHRLQNEALAEAREIVAAENAERDKPPSRLRAWLRRPINLKNKV